MRGSDIATILWAQAALLGTLVVAELRTQSIGRPIKTIAVDIALPEKWSHTLLLNLDVQELNEPCDPAKLRIDGYLLSQDDTGAGEGTFATADGSIVTASWNFTCRGPESVPWDQILALNVLSLNGRAVEATSFAAAFRQTNPARVLDVSGAPVWAPALPAEGEGDTVDDVLLLNDILSSKEGAEAEEDLTKEVQRIGYLREHIHELRELLDSRRMRLFHKLIEKGEQASSSTPSCAEASNSALCVLRSFRDKAQQTKSTVCDALSSWGKILLQCSKSPQRDPVSKDSLYKNVLREDEMTPQGAQEKLTIDVDRQGFNYSDDNEVFIDLAVDPPKSSPMTPILIAQITWSCAFILFCLIRLIQRLPSRQAPLTRGTFFHTFTRPLFRSNRNHDEDDDEEKGGNDRSTMEDEISSFRSATDLVESLIAAEEGRYSEKGTGCDDGLSLLEGDDDDDDDILSEEDDESLPGYDSEQEDAYASMVVNGHRYTPS